MPATFTGNDMTSHVAFRPCPSVRATLAALGISVLLVACANSPFSSGGAGTPEMAVPASASGAALDTMFLTRAMQSDMLEISASRLALNRTTSPQTHRFARQMVDDHTANGTELNQLAARLDMATTLPQPLPADEMKLQKLQNADDAQFEAMYIQMIALDAHVEAVTLFRQESAQGGNTELRTFAGRKVPVLEHHLAMGKTLSAASR
jgi:putative membrane protein